MSDEKTGIYMKDAPLARMGEMWAKLYYHMAKEMLALGLEGEEALRRSIKNSVLQPEFIQGELFWRRKSPIGLTNKGLALIFPEPAYPPSMSE